MLCYLLAHKNTSKLVHPDRRAQVMTGVQNEEYNCYYSFILATVNSKYSLLLYKRDVKQTLSKLKWVKWIKIVIKFIAEKFFYWYQ